MFVRRKVNKSGSTSVQVVDKSGGGYRVVCSLGTAREEWELKCLEAKGRQYVREHSHPELPLFGQGIDDRLEELVSGLGNSQVKVIGPEVIYGRLYDEIGYGTVGSRMFTWSSAACSTRGASSKPSTTLPVTLGNTTPPTRYTVSLTASATARERRRTSPTSRARSSASASRRRGGSAEGAWRSCSTT